MSQPKTISQKVFPIPHYLTTWPPDYLTIWRLFDYLVTGWRELEVCKARGGFERGQSDYPAHWLTPCLLCIALCNLSSWLLYKSAHLTMFWTHKCTFLQLAVCFWLFCWLTDPWRTVCVCTYVASGLVWHIFVERASSLSNYYQLGDWRLKVSVWLSSLLNDGPANVVLRCKDITNRIQSS